MTATKSEDRRHTERRISPSIGEFAIQECAKLRAENERLRAALRKFADLDSTVDQMFCGGVANDARALLRDLGEAA